MNMNMNMNMNKEKAKLRWSLVLTVVYVPSDQQNTLTCWPLSSIPHPELLVSKLDQNFVFVFGPQPIMHPQLPIGIAKVHQTRAYSVSVARVKNDAV